MIPVYQNGTKLGERITRSDNARDIKRYEARAEAQAKRGETDAAKASLAHVERLRRLQKCTPPERRRKIILPARLVRETRAAQAARWARRRTRKPAQRVSRPRAPRSHRRRTSDTSGTSAKSDGPSGDDSDPPHLDRLPCLDNLDTFNLDRASIATGLAKSTLSDALRYGRLPGEHVGGGPHRARWAITREALLTYLSRRQAVAVVQP